MRQTLVPALLIGVLSLPAFAQSPVGTPENGKGSPSSTGSASQQDMKTHTDAKGNVVTEDGRKVNPGTTAEPGAKPDDEAQPDHSSRTSGSGGAHDHSTDPGSLE